MKKKIMASLILLLILGLVQATYFSTNQSNTIENIISFENSKWNYIKGYGFIDDKTVETLEKQAFTENSRNYFLGEIK